MSNGGRGWRDSWVLRELSPTFFLSLDTLLQPGLCPSAVLKRYSVILGLLPRTSQKENICTSGSYPNLNEHIKKLRSDLN